MDDILDSLGGKQPPTNTPSAPTIGVIGVDDTTGLGAIIDSLQNVEHPADSTLSKPIPADAPDSNIVNEFSDIGSQIDQDVNQDYEQFLVTAGKTKELDETTDLDEIDRMGTLAQRAAALYSTAKTGKTTTYNPEMGGFEVSEKVRSTKEVDVAKEQVTKLLGTDASTFRLATPSELNERFERGISLRQYLSNPPPQSAPQELRDRWLIEAETASKFYSSGLAIYPSTETGAPDFSNSKVWDEFFSGDILDKEYGKKLYGIYTNVYKGNVVRSKFTTSQRSGLQKIGDIIGGRGFMQGISENVKQGKYGEAAGDVAVLAVASVFMYRNGFGIGSEMLRTALNTISPETFENNAGESSMTPGVKFTEGFKKDMGAMGEPAELATQLITGILLDPSTLLKSTVKARKALGDMSGIENRTKVSARLKTKINSLLETLQSLIVRGEGEKSLSIANSPVNLTKNSGSAADVADLMRVPSENLFPSMTYLKDLVKNKAVKPVLDEIQDIMKSLGNTAAADELVESGKSLTAKSGDMSHYEEILTGTMEDITPRGGEVSKMAKGMRESITEPRGLKGISRWEDFKVEHADKMKEGVNAKIVLQTLSDAANNVSQGDFAKAITSMRGISFLTGKADELVSRAEAKAKELISRSGRKVQVAESSLRRKMNALDVATRRNEIRTAQTVDAQEKSLESANKVVESSAAYVEGVKAKLMNNRVATDVIFDHLEKKGFPASFQRKLSTVGDDETMSSRFLDLESVDEVFDVLFEEGSKVRDGITASQARSLLRVWANEQSLLGRALDLEDIGNKATAILSNKGASLKAPSTVSDQLYPMRKSALEASVEEGKGRANTAKSAMAYAEGVEDDVMNARRGGSISSKVLDQVPDIRENLKDNVREALGVLEGFVKKSNKEAMASNTATNDFSRILEAILPDIRNELEGLGEGTVSLEAIDRLGSQFHEILSTSSAGSPARAMAKEMYEFMKNLRESLAKRAFGDSGYPKWKEMMNVRSKAVDLRASMKRMLNKATIAGVADNAAGKMSNEEEWIKLQSVIDGAISSGSMSDETSKMLTTWLAEVNPSILFPKATPEEAQKYLNHYKDAIQHLSKLRKSAASSTVDKPVLHTTGLTTNPGSPTMERYSKGDGQLSPTVSVGYQPKGLGNRVRQAGQVLGDATMGAGIAAAVSGGNVPASVGSFLAILAGGGGISGWLPGALKAGTNNPGAVSLSMQKMSRIIRRMTTGSLVNVKDLEKWADSGKVSRNVVISQLLRLTIASSLNYEGVDPELAKDSKMVGLATPEEYIGLIRKYSEEIPELTRDNYGDIAWDGIESTIEAITTSPDALYQFLSGNVADAAIAGAGKVKEIFRDDMEDGKPYTKSTTGLTAIKEEDFPRKSSIGR